MKKIARLMLSVAILAVTGCSTDRYIISDTTNTELVRTVTSEPVKVQIGKQYYSIYLSATDNGMETTWNLLVDQQYKPVEDGLILLRFGNKYTSDIEKLKVSHTGRFGSDTETYLSSDGKQTDRVEGWRATYPVDEKMLNFFSRFNLTKIRILSPRGYEESAVRPKSQAANIGTHITNARKAITKRLGIAHDRLIYDGF